MKNDASQPTVELFLEIDFRRAITEGDLTVVTEATRETPGLVRLERAVIKPHSTSSITKILYSWAGGDQAIGHIFPKSVVEGPYHSTYRIDPASLQQPTTPQPVSAPANGHK